MSARPTCGPRERQDPMLILKTVYDRPRSPSKPGVALCRVAVRTVVQFSKQRRAGQHRRCSGRLRNSHRRWPAWGFASRVGGGL